MTLKQQSFAARDWGSSWSSPAQAAARHKDTGRARIKEKLGGSTGNQDGPGRWGNCCRAGASSLQWGQVYYSDKAGEAFPSSKRCCRTVGLGGFARKQNCAVPAPTAHQQNAGEKQKNGEARGREITWFPTPRAKTASSPWEKLGNPHRYTALLSDLKKKESNAARERRGD